MRLSGFLPAAIILISVFTANAQHRSSHWNPSRGYSPFRNGNSTSLIIPCPEETTLPDTVSVDPPASDFRLTFRCANIRNLPYKHYQYTTASGATAKTSHPGWKLIISGKERQLSFIFRPTEISDAVSSVPAMEITSSGPQKQTVRVSKNLDFNHGLNSFRLESENGTIVLSCGNRTYQEVMRIDTGPFTLTSFGFLPDPGGEIKISDISLVCDTPSENQFSSDINNIETIISQSSDPLVGVWRVFDRELEESLLRQGGDYQLAIIPDERAEGYRLIYLSGAVKNADKWKKGMVKGQLDPSPFKNVFKLVWIDSELQPISKDVRAQLEDDLLTIQFPYHNSRLRLRKME